jgi:hypothetical protein
LRRHFAGHSGAHHAAADQGFELRRVAFIFIRARAVGEAVAEGEDDGAGGERLELGALAACREAKCERDDEKAC